jgi:hypothetical protein
MQRTKTIWLAAALLLGLGCVGPAQAASPALGAGAMARPTGTSLTEAALVCNAWGRCWRSRPRYYRYVYRPRIGCRTGLRYTAWGVAPVTRCYRYW